MVLAFVLALLSGAVAASDDIIRLDGSDMLRIGPQVRYLEDPDGTLTINSLRAAGDEVQWQQSRQNVLNFGYSQSAYWVLIRMVQTGSKLESVSYAAVSSQINRQGLQSEHMVLDTDVHIPNPNPNYLTKIR